MEEIKKEYEEILKVIGLDKAQKLTNEEGKIMFLGKRWILMDVEAFPEYMIKSTANIMGERMAREFIYWFGYSYGEKATEWYLSMGIPKEIIPKIAAAISTFIAGWGIPEFLELSLDRGRLVVKLHNDFESESAQINGSEPTNNFFRGLLAGAFAKLIGAKTHATAEFKDGVTVIVVEKR
jgi:predicted hydrocarbon binding protein